MEAMFTFLPCAPRTLTILLFSNPIVTLRAFVQHAKKTAYYVAFGPHGPRKPTSHPGDTLKIILAVAGAAVVAGAVGAAVKSFGESHMPLGFRCSFRILIELTVNFSSSST